MMLVLHFLLCIESFKQSSYLQYTFAETLYIEPKFLKQQPAKTELFYDLLYRFPCGLLYLIINLNKPNCILPKNILYCHCPYVAAIADVLLR